MAKILLIETATEVCSAAIAVDGQVVALAEELQQLNHAARLTLLIDACIKQAGIPLSSLDAVAVSRGPGSYTSLRVGASVAKGLCYALDKPLIAVDTLQALASAAFEVRSSKFEVQSPGSEPGTSNFKLQTSNSVLFMPMLDARRQEVWAAVYDSDLREVLPPHALILQNNLFQKFLDSAFEKSTADMLVVSGNGAKKLGSEMICENVAVSDIQHCSASHLAGPAELFFQSGEFQDVSYYEPFYMKPPNITTPNKPLF